MITNVGRGIMLIELLARLISRTLTLFPFSMCAPYEPLLFSCKLHTCRNMILYFPMNQQWSYPRKFCVMKITIQETSFSDDAQQSYSKEANRTAVINTSLKHEHNLQTVFCNCFIFIGCSSNRRRVSSSFFL